MNKLTISQLKMTKWATASLIFILTAQYFYNDLYFGTGFYSKEKTNDGVAL